MYRCARLAPGDIERVDSHCFEASADDRIKLFGDLVKPFCAGEIFFRGKIILDLDSVPTQHRSAPVKSAFYEAAPELGVYGLLPTVP